MITEARKKELKDIYESEKDKVGMCVACKEWTSAIEPCCGTSVYFEGSTLNWEDMLSDIAETEEEIEYLEAL